MFDSPLETDVVCYGETSISFTVLRIARRKSLAIEVHPDMRVLVRCPADCDEDTIRGRVTKRARWITRQQRYFAQFQPLPSARQYVSGETHFYLGRRYRLRVRRGDQPTVRIV
ncbi:MAG: DUF45 domain-containing protein, partial [Rhodocyclaceae bacterium]|nr:DUF45 domain-containing protein [Rhodocyclaceae bacterium]